MPVVDTYGISVGLEAASQPVEPGDTPTYTALRESKTDVVWQPTDGMLSPVYVTTVETPAKVLADYHLPFKFVVRFHRPSQLMEHMKGDTRIELLVDGVASGLKFCRESNIKGTGFQLEFPGYRIGRTEERPFVFLPLPKMSTALGFKGRGTQEIQNHGLSWVENSLALGNPDPIQMAGEPYPHEGLYPLSPAGVPPGVSVLQLVVSVGQRRRTIEKYLMGPGDTQTLATYSPPYPPVSLAMDIKRWKAPTSSGARKSGGIQSLVKGNVRGDSVEMPRPSILGGQEWPETLLESPSKQGAAWKPVGLGENVCKIPQLKEVEFSARLHLARFWFFVVPPQGLSLPTVDSPKPRMMVALKFPNKKRLKQLSQALDQTNNTQKRVVKGDKTVGDRTHETSISGFLAEAASGVFGVQQPSPASSDLTPLNSSSLGPEANELEDRDPSISPPVGCGMLRGYGTPTPGPGKATGIRKGVGDIRAGAGRKAKRQRTVFNK